MGDWRVWISGIARRGARRGRTLRLFVAAAMAVLVLGAAAAGGALPSCTDSAWGCERAHDPPGFAGSNTAIAFDAAGSAWVSFRDQDAQALMVARYLGTDGSCAGNTAWDCTVVDDPAGHDVGFETDIEFTADGTAWVSYQDTTTDDLKVAHSVASGTGSGCASSGWTCEVVDGSSQVGGYTAVAVENDTPLVTYWDAGRNDLRWARPGSGPACDVAGWSCGVVDSGAVGAYANDLAVDRLGRVWVAYRYSGSGSGPRAAKLVVATHDPTGGGSGCGTGSPEWNCAAIATTGNVGLDTGIAFDADGSPWVHYWNNQNLNLARLDLGGSGPRCSVAAEWECTTIHDAGDSLGEYGAIAFAPDGSAWIAYHGATAKHAYVAHYVGAGAGSGCGAGSTDWACSTLDASGDVGAFWMGIAIRPGSGEPWVSYYDRANGALKIAILQNSENPVPPTIESFTPSSGSPGTPVTITGSNFGGASSVTFNGAAATFSTSSSTQITATVPSSATTGPILVETPAGTGQSPGEFTVVTGAAPTITGFTPTSGTVGTVVTISGTNLTGATAVSFGGTAALAFENLSDTQLTATVPSRAKTGPINVVTLTGSATSSQTFRVTKR